MTLQNPTKRHHQAAQLVAEDELTDEQIARQIGVHRTTLADWKKEPVFVALVGDHIGQLQAAMFKHAVAKKRRRLAVLDDLHTKALTVIEERAAAMAEDCPGGGTGLMVRQTKVIGGGANAQTVTEYTVDAGLMREIRAIEEQAAKELGQWVEKSEQQQTITTVRLIGVPEDAI